MSGQLPPFRLDELEGADGLAGTPDVSDTLRAAREVERVAAGTRVRSPDDFTDRVMAAAAREPEPAPARAAGRALRAGRIAAFGAALVSAWRVAFGSGRPAVIRVQAHALVLVDDLVTSNHLPDIRRGNPALEHASDGMDPKDQAVMCHDCLFAIAGRLLAIDLRPPGHSPSRWAVL